LNYFSSAKGLIYLLRCLWAYFSPRRQCQLIFFLGLMLIGAIAEVVSLGSVLPFISILVAPEKVFNHPYAIDLVQVWGIASADKLVLPFTIVFVCIALFAGLVRLLLLWVNTQLTVAIGTDLSMEVYRVTLYQPYKVHISRNSSEVISGIINKVYSVIYGVLMPLLTLINAVFLLIAITLTLVAINPVVAFIACVGFGLAYGLITILAQPLLKKNGEFIAYEQAQLIKALQEGLGGIRDVLLNGTQSVYCDIYRKADYPIRKAYGRNLFIGQSPRFLMEVLGIVLIAVIAYSLRLNGGIETALPVLGALVFGAQRLVPALQHSYAAWSSIVGSQASLADIIEILNTPTSVERLKAGSTSSPLSFQNVITFQNVRFRFGSDDPWVLDGLGFSIFKGDRIGIVGKTGSGKSTMLDLLMGLLVPTEGEFLVDDRVVVGRYVRDWQEMIAHVPQTIYLADSSFLENIAFGVALKKIDIGLVRKVAQQAQIADFIESRPESYNALLGERGVRLSGGQRQRIGIARALYRQASVLVFDEATSALDSATEQSVMTAVEGLDRSLTILLIAHRINTVRYCDSIIELEQGKVVGRGTYEQLLTSSPSFKRMIQRE
jgi:ABC-type multidrug transport system fused ATPase/permease subunit